MPLSRSASPRMAARASPGFVGASSSGGHFGALSMRASRSCIASGSTLADTISTSAKSVHCPHRNTGDGLDGNRIWMRQLHTGVASRPASLRAPYVLRQRAAPDGERGLARGPTLSATDAPGSRTIASTEVAPRVMTIGCVELGFRTVTLAGVALTAASRRHRRSRRSPRARPTRWAGARGRRRRSHRERGAAVVGGDRSPLVCQVGREVYDDVGAGPLAGPPCRIKVLLSRHEEPPHDTAPLR